MARRTPTLKAAPSGGANGHGQARQAPTAELPPLPRQRRRRMLVLGVVMVAAGAVIAGYLFTGMSHRVAVIMVARAVPVGARITGADLGTTRIAAESNVSMIPTKQIRQIVGRIAAVDLRQGTLLAPSEITTALSPGPGQQVVPVSVKTSSVPARGLRPGDQVLVVPTPSSQVGNSGDVPGTTGSAPLTQNVPATVDAVGPPDTDGMRVVDLVVNAQVGPSIARQASTGRIAFIVTSREPS